METDAGLVHGWRLSESQYRVKLTNPGILDLNRKPGIAYVELGNPGVPHAVAPYSGDLWKAKGDPPVPDGGTAPMTRPSPRGQT